MPSTESPNPSQTLPFNVAGGIDGGMARLSPNAAEGAANVSLNAIEGATDGEYVVQPITVTFTAQLNTVAYVFGLVIEHPLTTRNNAPVQITVSVSPLPPAEDPQVTPPPPPPAPEPEEPTQTPVSDPPPQEGGNPPPSEPVTPPPPTDPEPADPPQTPVNNNPSPVEPSLGRHMQYFPPIAERYRLANNSITTIIFGGSFDYVTYPPNRIDGDGNTIRYARGNPTLDIVSVNITGDYGSSVFIIGQAGSYGGSDWQLITKHIYTAGLTTGGPGGLFWYSTVSYRHSGAPGISFTGTTPSVLDFFCGRGLITVLNYLAKRTFPCSVVGGNSRTEYRPNKSDIAGGALQDIGARGFAFAGSPAKFYARWGNKEKRKQAGFSYNFDTFALRTDYNKLPAAQDAKVMLDTYRVGVMPDIGKRHRLFAGVDNYRNGILAIQYSDAADTNTHTNIYKLGSVAGKGGYAVKFEWRVVWD